MDTRGNHVGSFRILAPILFAGLLYGCASSGGAERSDQDEVKTRESESAQRQSRGDSEKSDSSREAKSSAHTGKISDRELEEFILVSRRMQKIQIESRRALKRSKSKKEARKIERNVRAKLQSTFDNSSLTKERYRVIGERLQSDKALQKRLKKIDRRNRKSQPKRKRRSK